MESLIISPKNKSELNSFIELAKSLGTEIRTVDDLKDEHLLSFMEENKKSKKVDRQKILSTLNAVLSEK